MIYTVLNHFFHVEDGYVKYHEGEGKAPGTVTAIVAWVQNHYGYANIMMGVAIALWLKLFFRKHHYNFYEILIMLCFVMGIGMLIFSVFVIFQGLTHIEVMPIASVAGLLYCVWATGQFYEKRKAVSYIKAFFAYVMGMLTFWMLAVLIGTLIDLMGRHY